MPVQTSTLTIQKKMQKVFYQLSRKFTSRLTEKEIIYIMCEQCREFLGNDHNIYVIRRNHLTERLCIPVIIEDNQFINIREDQYEELFKRIGKEKVEQIIEKRQRLLLPDRANVIKLAKYSEEIAMSWLGVPLNISDKAIGVVVVCHKTQEYVYDDDIAETLDAITDFAASKIDQAHLIGKLNALSEVKREFSSLRNISEKDVVKIIANRTKEIVDTYNLLILMRHKQSTPLSIAFAYRKGILIENEQEQQKILEMMPDKAIEDIVRLNAYQLLNGEEDTKAKFKNIPSSRIPMTWLGVPMSIGKEVIGIIVVYHMRYKDIYNNDDIEILQDLAGQSAVAINNARLYAQAESLQLVARMINSSLDRKTVCEAVLIELCKIVYYDTASIQRIYGEQRTIIAYKGELFDKHDPQLLRDISEDPLISHIVKTKQPYVIPDTTCSNPYWEHLSSTERVRSWIGVPLIVNDEVIGLLTLDHFQANYYTEEHSKTALMFAHHAATALINVELFEKQQNYLNILKEVYPSISSSKKESLFQVMSHILDNGVKLTEADYADLWLFNEDTQEIHLEVDFANKRSQDLYRKGYRRFNISEKKSIVGHVALTKESYLCQDTNGDPYYFKVKEDVCTELAVPLCDQRRKVIGILNFESKIPYAFTAEHQRILEAIAVPLAIAIQNSHLYDEKEQVNRRLNALIGIGQTITAGIDLKQEEMLSLIFTEVSNQLDMKNFSIALYDELSNMIHFVFASRNGSPVNTENEPNWRPRHGKEGKTGEVIQTGKPLLLNSLAEVKKSQERYSSSYNTLSTFLANAWLGVPMIVGKRVVGVLADYHYGEDNFYKKDDVKIFQALANLIAIAIENARLYKQLQEKTQKQEMLIRLGQKLTSNIQLSEEKILHFIYENASELMDTSNMYIALYEQVTDTVRFGLVYEKGNKIDIKNSERYRSRSGGQGKTEWIIQNKKKIFQTTNAETQAWYRQSGRKDYVQLIDSPSSWLGVPMLIRDEVLGVIATYPTQEYYYTDDDCEILQAFANSVAIALENSALYKKQKDLQKEITAAKQLGTLSTAFAAIQHRVRNTLNIINPNVRRLRCRINRDDQEATEILDIIERNVRYTSDIIARIQEPLKYTDAQTVDINAIIEELKQKFEAQWLNNDPSPIYIKFSPDDSLSRIRASSGLVSEVFRNLFDNASRAMQKDGGTLKVISHKIDRAIQVIVQDTGKGIPAEIKERLFHKPVPSKDMTGGSGLGLWLNQLILQSISGTIRVEKSDFAGTTIVVEISASEGNEESRL